MTHRESEREGEIYSGRETLEEKKKKTVYLFDEIILPLRSSQFVTIHTNNAREPSIVQKERITTLNRSSKQK